MRFGIFGAAQADSSLSSAPMGQGFHDFIDFNVEAEALGYHSTFLVEHHFTGWNQVSATLTLLVMVLLPLPLNYANIIALPLLLGVGVSFNIYFVMNWRDGRREMLASATARAVAFSALTTGTAFSSLALSQHPGTASMGLLLLISLACTLAASLIFVPALFALLARGRARRSALATQAG